MMIVFDETSCRGSLLPKSERAVRQMRLAQNHDVPIPPHKLQRCVERTLGCIAVNHSLTVQHSGTAKHSHFQAARQGAALDPRPPLCSPGTTPGPSSGNSRTVAPTPSSRSHTFFVRKPSVRARDRQCRPARKKPESRR